MRTIACLVRNQGSMHAIVRGPKKKGGQAEVKI